MIRIIYEVGSAVKGGRIKGLIVVVNSEERMVVDVQDSDESETQKRATLT